ncbi:HTH_Tnp_Tc3_2 domain-containing protein [Trichonephila clavipes]|nr:HTH_Tnp_Tc3_2 domain-containing protein [Trichonephila clavipes]
MTPLLPEKRSCKNGTNDDRRDTLSVTDCNPSADFNAGPSSRATVRTTEQNIIDMRFQSRRPTRVPLLTARHKALRLAWTRQHQHWTVDYWKHVA